MTSRRHLQYGQLRPDAFASGAIVAAFAAAALITGYVIASGDIVRILLLLAVIVGVALLNALSLVLWLVLIGTLIISGPLIMFVPALEKAGWLFSMLGFLLTGAALLYAVIGRDHFARPPPAFVPIAVLFMTFGLLSLLYSDGPLAEGVRATKRYFQFMGVLFILATVPFPADRIRRWWSFLILLAVLQLVFALFQRIVLVPLREGMPRGVVPIDIVVGTMEGRLYGGGSSSVMVLLLVFMLAYLLSAVREGVLSMRMFLLLAAIVVTPLGLGEVNLTIILLPLALIAPFIDLVRRYPIRFVLGLALLLPALGFLGWTYLAMQAHPGQPLDLKIADIIEYNFGSRGYYGTGLNRTSVYSYWFAQHNPLADPVRFLFGHGLGSSFGNPDEPNPGHMDLAHLGMSIGLTAGSAVLWDLGLIGLLLFVAIHVSAVRHAYRLTQIAHAGFDRAFCRALLAMTLMLVVMLLYSEAPISIPSQQVLAMLCFGLIAWRWRSSEPFDQPQRSAAPRGGRQPRPRAGGRNAGRRVSGSWIHAR